MYRYILPLMGYSCVFRRSKETLIAHRPGQAGQPRLPTERDALHLLAFARRRPDRNFLLL